MPGVDIKIMVSSNRLYHSALLSFMSGWMADGLQPVTGTKKTQFCSWSATIVDSLDTLWIMGLEEEFDQAVNATMTIDFQHNANQCQVSLFESTIRYLGGFLAAYDLSHQPKILSKLVEVGDMLYSAFDTENGVPCSFCHLGGKQEGEEYVASADVSMADLGSLYLEFGRLSQITGDPKYSKAVDFLAHVFASTQADSTIPGLWPELVDGRLIGEPLTFARRSFAYSLGAMSDSSYEYLVKGHMLFGHITDIYSQMWFAAAEAIRDTLLYRAFIPDTGGRDILFSGVATRYPEIEDIQLEPRAQHLGCFAGGMFAMASKIFDEPTDFEIGKQLTEGCVWAYRQSPTGIMPETFSLLPCPGLDGVQCEWNQTEWNVQVPDGICGSGPFCFDGDTRYPDGYYRVGDARYILRPEAIESVFIMWRMTGDEYWRDVGWEMWESIIKHTRTPFGHSALRSVMETSNREVLEQGVLVNRPRATQADDMESFWFAETLKYFYLLYSEVDLIDLDEFVLNTEGKRPPASVSKVLTVDSTSFEID